jgi:beta-lactamase family protein
LHGKICGAINNVTSPIASRATGADVFSQLQETTRALAINTRGAHYFIAAAYGSSRHYAIAGRKMSGVEHGEQLLPLGCCSKLLVSALVWRAIEEGLLDLQTPLGRIVSSRTREYFNPISDISILQLINHTHGLPRSGLRTLAFSVDGRLDVESLMRSMKLVGRLAPPGAIYSYGPEGAWICAAILEDVWSMSFSDLLRMKIFSPEAISVTNVGGTICPSSGGNLAVKAEALLAFLLHYSATATAKEIEVSLPGWSPFVFKCAGGWHAYEASWTGHDSVLPELPMIVRADPVRDLAIIVAAKGLPPSAVASRAFSGVLPDLVKLRLPKMKPSRDQTNLRLEAYCGSYQNGDMTIDIAPRGQALGWRLSHGSPAAHECIPNYEALVPAEEEVFLCMGRGNKIIPFVQFVESVDGVYRFIWTGESVLSRR